MALFVTLRQALTVCELVDALVLPQYQVSRHVRQLKESGLIKVNKKGVWSYYYLNHEGDFNKQLFDFLEKSLKTDQLEMDKQAINVRLSFRKNGKCVLGSVSQSEIQKYIIY